MNSTFAVVLLLVLTIFVTFLYLVVYGIVRRLDALEGARADNQSSAPRMGSAAGESIALPTRFEQLVLRLSPAGAPVLVVFAQEDCQPCAALFEDLEEKGPIDLPPTVLVAPAEHSGQLVIRQTRSEVATFVDPTRDVASAFRTDVAPHAFVFDPRAGVVLAQDLVATADQLLTLIKRADTLGAKEELSA